jgi:hypothetical protein
MWPLAITPRRRSHRLTLTLAISMPCRGATRSEAKASISDRIQPTAPRVSIGTSDNTIAGGCCETELTHITVTRPSSDSSLMFHAVRRTGGVRNRDACQGSGTSI